MMLLTNTETTTMATTTATKTTVKFTKAVRNAVCAASDGQPSLGAWLNRIRDLNDPLLSDAIEGIWCGKEGRVTLDLPGSKSMLCMGWYNSRVEWSYIS
jgi:hypothetical protein